MHKRNLGKGKACDVCRNRKLRCDGLRPLCTPCEQYWQRHARRRGGQQGIQLPTIPSCNYRDDKEHRLSEGSRGSSQTHHQSSGMQSRKTTSEAPLVSPSPFLVESSYTSSHLNAVSLPTGSQLQSITSTFFEAFAWPGLFQPERFHQRLLLNADHAEALPRAVLHVIVALALIQRPSPDKNNDGLGGTSVLSQQHTRCAIHEIANGIHSSHKLFDVIRALVLLTTLQFAQGDALEASISCASAIRLAIALNLTNIASGPRLLQVGKPRIHDESPLAFYPKDVIEAEEARRTMAAIFMSDRLVGAVTATRSTIVELDYTAEVFTVPLRTFLEGTNETIQRCVDLAASSNNTFQALKQKKLSPDHPEIALLKGMMALGCCSDYVVHSKSSSIAMDSQSSTFRLLESDVVALQLQISSTLTTRPPEEKYCSVWTAARLTPVAALLLLHEPLAMLQEESEMVARQACLGILYIAKLSAASSRESLSFHPFVVWMYSLAGRSLIRQLEGLFQKAINEQSAVSDLDLAGPPIWLSEAFREQIALLQSEFEITLGILSQYGSKWRVAMRMKKALSRLVQFDGLEYLRPLVCFSEEGAKG